MRTQKRSGFALLLLAALMFVGTSCDKENVEQRPELPPVESMMMDFSDFSEQPAGAKGSAVGYQNFSKAYLTVGFWNLSVTLVSAIPVAAYAHALKQEAVYMGDQNWEWSYEFVLNGASYTANLNAERTSNEEFSVSMLIAFTALPDNGVKWFEGVVRYDHTKADWTFFKDGTIPVMEVSWNRDFETEEADLTYSFTEPGHKEDGSYIMWEYLPGEFFDASYTVSMADGTTEIDWNAESIQGRIFDPVFFGDENWHCWDTYANGLADMDCE